MAAAIVNSNNVIFAKGGGGGSQIEIESPDNSIAVSNETVGSAEKYKLSVNTNIIATKESVDEVKTGLNNLTGTVDNHTVQIGQIQEDIEGIENTYVSVNLTQDFTDAQKGTARTNIGAADASAFNKLSNTVGNLSYKVNANTAALVAMKWRNFKIDLNVTVEATQLLTVGNLIIGYYFDNGGVFRLSMKSTSGTRYIDLSDNMGYGGGYQVTDSSWTGITMKGFSSSCQYESLIGYDCTADTPIHFEVQFATSPNPSFGTICRYRVLES